ncbi:Fc.00g024260.m01.CDS01 [Cosmosporella sp. VM-42]
MSNEDVYTNPPSNTYMLNSRFSAALDGNSIAALAVSNQAAPLLLALYAIIIQSIFSAIWQLFAAIMLVKLSAKNRLEVVGLVAFWNRPDPISATISSFQYLLVTLTPEHRTWRTVRRALMMIAVAGATMTTSITIGILYPDWLRLGSFAPVHPSSIYWAPFDTVSNEVVVDIYSQARPGVLRALGSAEAGDLNSKIPAVDIRKVPRPDHTAEEPQTQVDYNYEVKAQDFALQKYSNLVMKVSGSCRTDYTWATRRTSASNFTWDYYYPWKTEDSSQIYRTATELSPSYLLDFVTWVHPDIDQPQQYRNRSFALLAATALAPSPSHSEDPWYQTQSSNGSEYSLDFQYTVKSQRPVLDCWETTEICVGESCYDSYLEDSPLPEGLAIVFRTRFAHPMMTHISQAAGVATIKSYVGSASGAFLDAAASSLFQDMTRLILAGYLSSRQVFQEIALTPRPSTDSPNLLDAAVGKLREGAEDFVVHTNGAVALRLDLLVLAPTLCVLLWTIVTILEAFKRRGIWRDFSAKAAALTATQIFRQLDEHLSDDRWRGSRATIPNPPSERGSTTMDVGGSAFPPTSGTASLGAQAPSIIWLTLETQSDLANQTGPDGADGDMDIELLPNHEVASST